MFKRYTDKHYVEFGLVAGLLRKKRKIMSGYFDDNDQIYYPSGFPSSNDVSDSSSDSLDYTLSEEEVNTAKAQTKENLQARKEGRVAKKIKKFTVGRYKQESEIIECKSQIEEDKRKAMVEEYIKNARKELSIIYRYKGKKE